VLIRTRAIDICWSRRKLRDSHTKMTLYLYTPSTGRVLPDRSIRSWGRRTSAHCEGRLCEMKGSYIRGARNLYPVSQIWNRNHYQRTADGVQLVRDSVESEVSRPFALIRIVPTCHFWSYEAEYTFTLYGSCHSVCGAVRRTCTPRYVVAWRFTATKIAVFYLSSCAHKVTY